MSCCIPTPDPPGMLYLHTRSPPIIHRDLKSPNLVGSKGSDGA